MEVRLIKIKMDWDPATPFDPADAQGSVLVDVDGQQIEVEFAVCAEDEFMGGQITKSPRTLAWLRDRNGGIERANFSYLIPNVITDQEDRQYWEEEFCHEVESILNTDEGVSALRRELREWEEKERSSR